MEQRTSDKPLVSVITPVFNGAKFLEECILSVLVQSYPGVEHVLVDGGSKDGTLDILKKYQAEHPGRIRFISEPDKGSGDAINKGFKMAKGEILGVLCADDTYEPKAIQKTVEFFGKNPETFFIFGACNYIDKHGRLIKKGLVKDFDLEQTIREANYVPMPSSFYRREVVDRVGFYDDLGNDLDWLIRAGKIFKIHRIERALSNFRVHEDSATTGLRSKTRKMWLKEDCCVSRRHGGGFFNGYCRRYYLYLIFGPIILLVKKWLAK